MLLGVEIKKRLNGEWYNYPPAEFNGMTVRDILVFIDQQDIVVKIEQGMGKNVYIVGKEQTLAEYSGNRKHNFITVKEALSLWNNSPLLGIVWPPFRTDAPPEPQEDYQGTIARLAMECKNKGEKAPHSRNKVKRAA